MGTISAKRVIRHRRETSDYLALRLREDEQGGEAGLLPLKIRPVQDPRDDLLGVRQGVSGLGAAQLHEELGGQLADVSMFTRFSS